MNGKPAARQYNLRQPGERSAENLNLYLEFYLAYKYIGIKFS